HRMCRARAHGCCPARGGAGFRRPWVYVRAVAGRAEAPAGDKARAAGPGGAGGSPRAGRRGALGEGTEMPIQYALFENKVSPRPGEYAAAIQATGSAGLETIVARMLDRGSTVGRADIAAVLE